MRSPRCALLPFVALLGVATVRAQPPSAPHLSALGAARWHADGYQGQGIKVAVLDSGFRGYRDHLGRGLPRTVLARSFRLDADLEARDSSHGVLCGEVIRALAPK